MVYGTLLQFLPQGQCLLQQLPSAQEPSRCAVGGGAIFCLEHFCKNLARASLRASSSLLRFITHNANAEESSCRITDKVYGWHEWSLVQKQGPGPMALRRQV